MPKPDLRPRSTAFFVALPPPTFRQLIVLAAIARLTRVASESHEPPPTFRDVGADVGMRSTRSVTEAVQSLRRKALLEPSTEANGGRLIVTVKGATALVDFDEAHARAQLRIREPEEA